VVLGVGLQAVHHVGELHAVPDEEHRDVVAHQVKVALPAASQAGRVTFVMEQWGKHPWVLTACWRIAQPWWRQAASPSQPLDQQLRSVHQQCKQAAHRVQKLTATPVGLHQTCEQTCILSNLTVCRT
jgi:monoamine oxidase